MKPLVVGISGYSGVGKSTIIYELSKILGPSVICLFFDDYVSRSDFPVNIKDWIQDGANPNVIKTPILREHLKALVQGRSVIAPISNGWAKEHLDRESIRTINPGKIILLEEPFGREREEIKDLIDIVIYLDVPLEIALARRILDLNKSQELRNDPMVLINLLDHFLIEYLYNGVRDMYFEIGNKIKNNCDTVINATQELAQIIEDIMNYLKDYKVFDCIIRK
ncbi:nucleoside/nucleotide kinase family protein [Paenibacillus albiflavus]|uniref:AAA family ATPase n=1 Tax=Paenibacillus albiflavus TaxID=2545760 RepID=UPI001404B487|nr:AAA family ATPase [Paenibacillus albiflavus]